VELDQAGRNVVYGVFLPEIVKRLLAVTDLEHGNGRQILLKLSRNLQCVEHRGCGAWHAQECHWQTAQSSVQSDKLHMYMQTAGKESVSGFSRGREVFRNNNRVGEFRNERKFGENERDPDWIELN
jgi:hypothetical protein